MTVRELFEFITDPSVTRENMDAYLLKVRGARKGTEQKMAAVTVFVQHF